MDEVTIFGMDLSFFLPTLNMSLNLSAFICLGVGYWAIKSGKREAHRNAMILAFTLSAMFLASDLFYHFNFPSRAFQGEGWVRPLYFTILISHIILAVVILPFIFRLLFLAHRQRWLAHRNLARWVWPSWMYTSLTGVLVYLFLYIWFPEGAIQ